MRLRGAPLSSRVARFIAVGSPTFSAMASSSQRWKKTCGVGAGVRVVETGSLVFAANS